MPFKRKLTVLASTALLTPAALAGAIAPASAATGQAAADSCADYPYAVAGEFREGWARESTPYNYLVPQEGAYTACLDGPADANFDLEVLQWNTAAGGYQLIAASRNADSTERVTWDSPANSTQYRLRVVATSGYGTYTVGVRFPGEA
ncbi:hypothetical protein [Kineosporia sp. NBRC 101731]|uniref:hypothetical protein n=1 Tax=Kineosporia sp. NBRC 101731 TaxID=3032199 RepID=UPI0024A5CA05|nr:hypothetical protein [Kineosporia sp. NBRC 101731]GLY29754.1 hypothetical protein Kisp02_31190 [Kineosporia sp. NBRC 101731]